MAILDVHIRSNRGSIEPWQRHKRRNPCRICGGGEDDQRRRGIRCAGYISKDERYEYCEHPDYSGSLELNERTSPPTYKHKLHGRCNCGHEHGAAEARPMPARTPERSTPAAATRAHQRMCPDRTHLYRNADGSERFRVLRVGNGSDKRFVQQRPDGAGDWLDGLDGLTPVLYRLPELLAADPAQPVYIVEGEKCADELIQRGLVATTNAGGALKWHNTPGARDYLQSRHVIILPDNDPEKPDKPHESRIGQRHAAEVAADLYGVAASVRMLMLPGLPVKGDVYDWLAAGHAVDELQALMEVWPEWAPAAAPAIPQSLNSTGAMQDASWGETSTTCGTCPTYTNLRREVQSLRDQLRIAETSLANLRRERALEDQWMAVSNEKLGAPEKLTLLAFRRELTDNTHERNDQGLARIPRTFIARRTGVKEQAAGAHLIKLQNRQLIVRDKITVPVTSTREGNEEDSEDNTPVYETVTYQGPGPLYNAPEAVEAPERANSWGGKRKPLCPSCKSAKLIATSYTCENCGCTTTAQAAFAASVAYDLEVAADRAREEAQLLNSIGAMQDASWEEDGIDGSELPAPAQPDAQPAIQDQSSPLDIRAAHLVSRAINSGFAAQPEAPDGTLDDALGVPAIPSLRIVNAPPTPPCPDCGGATWRNPLGRIVCRTCLVPIAPERLGAEAS